MKDGFYACVHTLSNEDPMEALRLRQRWPDDMRPRNVAEEAVVDECYHGHLMSKRYHRAKARALQSQQRDIIEAWYEAKENLVRDLHGRIDDNPEPIVDDILERLKGFGVGIAYIIETHEDLAAALRERGFWYQDEIQLGVLMTGVRPGPEAARVRAETYKLVLWSLHCDPRPRTDLIERMLQPANRPEELRSATRAELPPPPSECRAAVLQWLDETVAELREVEDRVLREHDGPQLAFVVNQGAILNDPERAEQFRRAGSEYKTTLYRALNTLRAMRKEEAPADDDGPGRPDRNDPAGSADSAGRAAGQKRGRRTRRAAARKGDGETPATVSETSAAGVETPPAGEPQVPAELKVDEGAQGEKFETQNEPTAAAETGPENGGIPTAGADGSRPGCLRSSPPAVRRWRKAPSREAVAERLGAGPPGCDPRHPVPSEGPPEALALGDAPALTRPSATLSQGERVLGAAVPERQISPWIPFSIFSLQPLQLTGYHQRVTEIPYPPLDLACRDRPLPSATPGDF
jgi:hypothetical protein